MNPGSKAGLAGVFLAATSWFFSACGGRNPGSLNRPLSRFDQEITAPVKRLRMHSGQTIQLPVVVKNTGQENWATMGSAPVLLSYRWLSNETPLPVEGERTALPGVLRPGASIPIQVRVTAPVRTGSLVLAVSMVQEGVAWFLSSGGRPLRIQVELADSESNSPLSVFDHKITSNITQLSLKPMQVVEVPVTIQNVTGEVWSTTGSLPA